MKSQDPWEQLEFFNDQWPGSQVVGSKADCPSSSRTMAPVDPVGSAPPTAAEPHLRASPEITGWTSAPVLRSNPSQAAQVT